MPSTRIEINKDMDQLVEKLSEYYGEEKAREILATKHGGIFDRPVSVNEPPKGQSESRKP
jgi:hypothetical protein